MLLGEVQATFSHSKTTKCLHKSTAADLQTVKSQLRKTQSSSPRAEKLNTLNASIEHMNIEEEEALLIPALEGLDAMATDLFCSQTPILICRNKHFPYIASYHGPWLSLPIELLQTILTMNDARQNADQTAPIDPILLRNLIEIRCLVEDASNLVLKAAGGGHTMNSNGFISKVSHVRQYRLRELAVSKLAKAYAIDEIATSVLMMQSASALDDVAQKVLKKNPDNADALYVHFYHEKIPSRMLATYTTTDVLDQIMRTSPPACHYYRTRAMIHGFRGDFIAALKDFKMALQLVKKRKKTSQKGCVEDISMDEAQLLFLRGACLHQYAVSLIEQAVRKVAYSQQVIVSVTRKKNKKKKKKNKIEKEAETTLQVDNEPSHTIPINYTLSCPSDVPYNGSGHSISIENYQREFSSVSSQVADLAQRSIRDFSQFLSFFPCALPPFQHYCGRFTKLISATDTSSGTQGGAMDSTSLRSLITHLSTLPMPAPPSFSADRPSVGHFYENGQEEKRKRPISTYHPLLVEAWYAIALNYLLADDWRSSFVWHQHLFQLEKEIECYPVFLYARSMSQADYLETVRYLINLSNKEAGEADMPITDALLSEDGPESANTTKRNVLHTKRANIMMASHYVSIVHF